MGEEESRSAVKRRERMASRPSQNAEPSSHSLRGSVRRTSARLQTRCKSRSRLDRSHVTPTARHGDILQR